MARSDLLLQLVESGTKGDKLLFKKVVEAIIAEERAKQHYVLADKLQENLNNTLSPISQYSYQLNGLKKDVGTDHLVSETVPTKRINDLILPSFINDTCRELINEHLRADLLRSYNLEPRHRILFVGPPGNGKTSLAESLATELMLPFLSVRYESLISSYLGETSSRLMALFDYVRTQQCVLFFDEFDALGKERGDKHETGEIKRVVSSLLLQIDRLPSYVIVIAATNHPELLDRAVWRRFQLKVSLPKPNQKEIHAYILNFQSQFNISFGYQPSYISKFLTGFSFSEINDFCIDVVRKFVLQQSKAPNSIKTIIKEKIGGLKSMYRPKPNN